MPAGDRTSKLFVEALRRIVVDNAQPADPVLEVVAAAEQGVAYEQVRGTSKQESASSARIDPAAMQRVELKLRAPYRPNC